MSIFGKIYFETFKMVRMDHHPHWAGNQATTGVRLRSRCAIAIPRPIGSRHPLQTPRFEFTNQKYFIINRGYGR